MLGVKMQTDKKGYWIYSIVVVIVGFALFGLFGYLIYDLIIKLADKDFSNNTVIQALITLVITVFIGGYFSKSLELRNTKKIELYKIQTTISLRIIDLATVYYYKQDEDIKRLLIGESSKVKLYFNDEVLENLNNFISSNKKNINNNYGLLVDSLKKYIK